MSSKSNSNNQNLRHHGTGGQDQKQEQHHPPQMLQPPSLLVEHLGGTSSSSNHQSTTSSRKSSTHNLHTTTKKVNDGQLDDDDLPLSSFLPNLYAAGNNSCRDAIISSNNNNKSGGGIGSVTPSNRSFAAGRSFIGGGSSYGGTSPVVVHSNNTSTTPTKTSQQRQHQKAGVSPPRGSSLSPSSRTISPSSMSNAKNNNKHSNNRASSTVEMLSNPQEALDHINDEIDRLHTKIDGLNEYYKSVKGAPAIRDKKIKQLEKELAILEAQQRVLEMRVSEAANELQTRAVPALLPILKQQNAAKSGEHNSAVAMITTATNENNSHNNNVNDNNNNNQNQTSSKSKLQNSNSTKRSSSIHDGKNKRASSSTVAPPHSNSMTNNSSSNNNNNNDHHTTNTTSTNTNAGNQQQQQQNQQTVMALLSAKFTEPVDPLRMSQTEVSSVRTLLKCAMSESIDAFSTSEVLLAHDLPSTTSSKSSSTGGGGDSSNKTQHSSNKNNNLASPSSSSFPSFNQEGAPIQLSVASGPPSPSLVWLVSNLCSSAVAQAFVDDCVSSCPSRYEGSATTSSSATTQLTLLPYDRYFARVCMWTRSCIAEFLLLLNAMSISSTSKQRSFGAPDCTDLLILAVEMKHLQLISALVMQSPQVVSFDWKRLLVAISNRHNNQNNNRENNIAKNNNNNIFTEITLLGLVEVSEVLAHRGLIDNGILHTLFASTANVSDILSEATFESGAGSKHQNNNNSNHHPPRHPSSPSISQKERFQRRSFEHQIEQQEKQHIAQVYHMTNNNNNNANNARESFQPRLYPYHDTSFVAIRRSVKSSVKDIISPFWKHLSAAQIQEEREQELHHHQNVSSSYSEEDNHLAFAQSPSQKLASALKKNDEDACDEDHHNHNSHSSSSSSISCRTPSLFTCTFLAPLLRSVTVRSDVPAVKKRSQRLETFLTTTNNNNNQNPGASMRGAGSSTKHNNNNNKSMMNFASSLLHSSSSPKEQNNNNYYTNNSFENHWQLFDVAVPVGVGQSTHQSIVGTVRIGWTTEAFGTVFAATTTTTQQSSGSTATSPTSPQTPNQNTTTSTTSSAPVLSVMDGFTSHSLASAPNSSSIAIELSWLISGGEDLGSFSSIVIVNGEEVESTRTDDELSIDIKKGDTHSVVGCAVNTLTTEVVFMIDGQTIFSTHHNNHQRNNFDASSGVGNNNNNSNNTNASNWAFSYLHESSAHQTRGTKFYPAVSCACIPLSASETVPIVMVAENESYDQHHTSNKFAASSPSAFVPSFFGGSAANNVVSPSSTLRPHPQESGPNNSKKLKRQLSSIVSTKRSDSFSATRNINNNQATTAGKRGKSPADANNNQKKSNFSDKFVDVSFAAAPPPQGLEYGLDNINTSAVAGEDRRTITDCLFAPSIAVEFSFVPCQEHMDLIQNGVGFDSSFSKKNNNNNKSSSSSSCFLTIDSKLSNFVEMLFETIPFHSTPKLLEKVFRGSDNPLLDDDEEEDDDEKEKVAGKTQEQTDEANDHDADSKNFESPLNFYSISQQTKERRIFFNDWWSTASKRILSSVNQNLDGHTKHILRFLQSSFSISRRRSIHSFFLQSSMPYLNPFEKGFVRYNLLPQLLISHHSSDEQNNNNNSNNNNSNNKLLNFTSSEVALDDPCRAATELMIVLRSLKNTPQEEGKGITFSFCSQPYYVSSSLIKQQTKTSTETDNKTDEQGKDHNNNDEEQPQSTTNKGGSERESPCDDKNSFMKASGDEDDDDALNMSFNPSTLRKSLLDHYRAPINNNTNESSTDKNNKDTNCDENNNNNNATNNNNRASTTNKACSSSSSSTNNNNSGKIFVVPPIPFNLVADGPYPLKRAIFAGATKKKGKSIANNNDKKKDSSSNSSSSTLITPFLSALLHRLRSAAHSLAMHPLTDVTTGEVLGMTPLMIAVALGYDEIVDCIVSRILCGIDIKDYNNSNTTTDNNNNEKQQQKPSSPFWHQVLSKRSRNGLTVLHIAASMNRFDILMKLLELLPSTTSSSSSTSATHESSSSTNLKLGENLRISKHLQSEQVRVARELSERYEHEFQAQQQQRREQMMAASKSALYLVDEEVASSPLLRNPNLPTLTPKAELQQKQMSSSSFFNNSNRDGGASNEKQKYSPPPPATKPPTTEELIDDIIEQKTSYGNTVLLLACKLGAPSEVARKLLFELGADVTVTDSKGTSCLLAASCYGSKETASTIVNYVRDLHREYIQFARSVPTLPDGTSAIAKEHYLMEELRKEEEKFLSQSSNNMSPPSSSSPSTLMKRKSSTVTGSSASSPTKSVITYSLQDVAFTARKVRKYSIECEYRKLRVAASWMINSIPASDALSTGFCARSLVYLPMKLLLSSTFSSPPPPPASAIVWACTRGSQFSDVIQFVLHCPNYLGPFEELVCKKQQHQQQQQQTSLSSEKNTHHQKDSTTPENNNKQTLSDTEFTESWLKQRLRDSVGGINSLFAAIANGNEQTAMTLLEIAQAKLQGHLLKTKSISKFGEAVVDSSALHRCASILNLDYSPDHRSKATALHLAAQGQMTKLCVKLLNLGADINAKDIFNNTPLHLSGRCGSLEQAHQMIKAGRRFLNVNNRDDSGETILHIACRAGHTALIQTLLQDCRADPNACALKNDGLRPLHAVIMSKNAEAFDTLMTISGPAIDFEAKYKNSKTALDLTLDYGMFEFAKRIIIQFSIETTPEIRRLVFDQDEKTIAMRNFTRSARANHQHQHSINNNNNKNSSPESAYQNTAGRSGTLIYNQSVEGGPPNLVMNRIHSNNNTNNQHQQQQTDDAKNTNNNNIATTTTSSVTFTAEEEATTTAATTTATTDAYANKKKGSPSASLRSFASRLRKVVSRTPSLFIVRRVQSSDMLTLVNSNFMNFTPQQQQQQQQAALLSSSRKQSLDIENNNNNNDDDSDGEDQHKKSMTLQTNQKRLLQEDPAYCPPIVAKGLLTVYSRLELIYSLTKLSEHVNYKDNLELVEMGQELIHILRERFDLNLAPTLIARFASTALSHLKPEKWELNVIENWVSQDNKQHREFTINSRSIINTTSNNNNTSPARDLSSLFANDANNNNNHHHSTSPHHHMLLYQQFPESTSKMISKIFSVLRTECSKKKQSGTWYLRRTKDLAIRLLHVLEDWLQDINVPSAAMICHNARERVEFFSLSSFGAGGGGSMIDGGDDENENDDEDGVFSEAATFGNDAFGNSMINNNNLNDNSSASASSMGPRYFTFKEMSSGDFGSPTELPIQVWAEDSAKRILSLLTQKLVNTAIAQQQQQHNNNESVLSSSTTTSVDTTSLNNTTANNNNASSVLGDGDQLDLGSLLLTPLGEVSATQVVTLMNSAPGITALALVFAPLSPNLLTKKKKMIDEDTIITSSSSSSSSCMFRMTHEKHGLSLRRGTSNFSPAPFFVAIDACSPEKQDTDSILEALFVSFPKHCASIVNERIPLNSNSDHEWNSSSSEEENTSGVLIVGNNNKNSNNNNINPSSSAEYMFERRHTNSIISDNTVTPLQAAIRTSNLSAVETLIRFGAECVIDFKSPEKDSITSAIHFDQTRDGDMVRLLLAHGHFDLVKIFKQGTENFVDVLRYSSQLAENDGETRPRYDSEILSGISRNVSTLVGTTTDNEEVHHQQNRKKSSNHHHHQSQQQLASSLSTPNNNKNSKKKTDTTPNASKTDEQQQQHDDGGGGIVFEIPDLAHAASGVAVITENTKDSSPFSAAAATTHEHKRKSSTSNNDGFETDSDKNSSDEEDEESNSDENAPKISKSFALLDESASHHHHHHQPALQDVARYVSNITFSCLARDEQRNPQELPVFRKVLRMLGNDAWSVIDLSSPDRNSLVLELLKTPSAVSVQDLLETSPSHDDDEQQDVNNNINNNNKNNNQQQQQTPTTKQSHLPQNHLSLFGSPSSPLFPTKAPNNFNNNNNSSSTARARPVSSLEKRHEKEKRQKIAERNQKLINRAEHVIGENAGRVLSDARYRLVSELLLMSSISKVDPKTLKEQKLKRQLHDKNENNNNNNTGSSCSSSSCSSIDESEKVFLACYRNKNGITPLHWAITWRHTDLIETLLTEMASSVSDVACSGLTPWLLLTCLPTGFNDAMRLSLVVKQLDPKSRQRFLRLALPRTHPVAFLYVMTVCSTNDLLQTVVNDRHSSRFFWGLQLVASFPEEVPSIVSSMLTKSTIDPLVHHFLKKISPACVCAVLSARARGMNLWGGPATEVDRLIRKRRKRKSTTGGAATSSSSSPTISTTAAPTTASSPASSHAASPSLPMTSHHRSLNPQGTAGKATTVTNPSNTGTQHLQDPSSLHPLQRSLSAQQGGGGRFVLSRGSQQNGGVGGKSSTRTSSDHFHIEQVVYTLVEQIFYSQAFSLGAQVPIALHYTVILALRLGIPEVILLCQSIAPSPFKLAHFFSLRKAKIIAAASVQQSILKLFVSNTVESGSVSTMSATTEEHSNNNNNNNNQEQQTQQHSNKHSNYVYQASVSQLRALGFAPPQVAHLTRLQSTTAKATASIIHNNNNKNASSSSAAANSAPTSIGIKYNLLDWVIEGSSLVPSCWKPSQLFYIPPSSSSSPSHCNNNNKKSSNNSNNNEENEFLESRQKLLSHYPWYDENLFTEWSQLSNSARRMLQVTRSETVSFQRLKNTVNFLLNERAPVSPSLLCLLRSDPERWEHADALSTNLGRHGDSLLHITVMREQHHCAYFLLMNSSVRRLRHLLLNKAHRSAADYALTPSMLQLLGAFGIAHGDQETPCAVEIVPSCIATQFDGFGGPCDETTVIGRFFIALERKMKAARMLDDKKRRSHHHHSKLIGSGTAKSSEDNNNNTSTTSPLLPMSSFGTFASSILGRSGSFSMVNANNNNNKLMRRKSSLSSMASHDNTIRRLARTLSGLKQNEKLTPEPDEDIVSPLPQFFQQHQQQQKEAADKLLANNKKRSNSLIPLLLNNNDDYDDDDETNNRNTTYNNNSKKKSSFISSPSSSSPVIPPGSGGDFHKYRRERDSFGWQSRDLNSKIVGEGNGNNNKNNQQPTLLSLAKQQEEEEEQPQAQLDPETSRMLGLLSLPAWMKGIEETWGVEDSFNSSVDAIFNDNFDVSPEIQSKLQRARGGSFLMKKMMEDDNANANNGNKAITSEEARHLAAIKEEIRGEKRRATRDKRFNEVARTLVRQGFAVSRAFYEIEMDISNNNTVAGTSPPTTYSSRQNTTTSTSLASTPASHHNYQNQNPSSHQYSPTLIGTGGRSPPIGSTLMTPPPPSSSSHHPNDNTNKFSLSSSTTARTPAASSSSMMMTTDNHLLRTAMDDLRQNYSSMKKVVIPSPPSKQRQQSGGGGGVSPALTARSNISSRNTNNISSVTTTTSSKLDPVVERSRMKLIYPPRAPTCKNLGSGKKGGTLQYHQNQSEDGNYNDHDDDGAVSGDDAHEEDFATPTVVRPNNNNSNNGFSTASRKQQNESAYRADVLLVSLPLFKVANALGLFGNSSSYLQQQQSTSGNNNNTSSSVHWTDELDASKVTFSDVVEQTQKALHALHVHGQQVQTQKQNSLIKQLQREQQQLQMQQQQLKEQANNNMEGTMTTTGGPLLNQTSNNNSRSLGLTRTMSFGDFMNDNNLKELTTMTKAQLQQIAVTAYPQSDDVLTKNDMLVVPHYITSENSNQYQMRKK